MHLYYGVVENRDDPLKLGRCQVRIVGLHTHDKTILPTTDLPWAYPMQPVTSAAMNGIGWTPIGPVEGSSVVIIFADQDQQQPIMIGTVGGIPQSKASQIATEDSGNIITDGGVVTSPTGEAVKKPDGTVLDITNQVGTVTSEIDKQISNIKSAVQSAATAIFGADITGIFGDKPKVNQAEQTLTLPVTGADDPSKPTVIPPVQSGSDAPLTAQPEPGKANDKVLNAPIVLEPMPKYAPANIGLAKKSIQELVAACDKVGLTSKYAKAAILGICGGESQWLPVEEGHVYSKPQSLLNTFPSIFNGDVALATEYSGGKKTKEQFFELIYGYKFPKGKGLGNTAPGDGGKYYGRGFNQLTGKAGYKQAQDEMKKYGVSVDLLNNPGLLISDVSVAALACAIFYKVNVKHDQNDPGYFIAARARTGKDAHGGYEKKRIMYEYYLGQGVLGDSSNKPAADEVKTYSKEEVSYLPPAKQKALLEDRSENSTTGFTDPRGKYPLRNLLDEPDTNRLARGVIKETAIAFKDQIRSKGIPAPFGASWEQPLAPFGGRYPYNKVYETESGHLQVFDDTPGHETLSLYHKKGTFIDVDANGTQVNKIVGDGYTIYDRNGMIYVTGKCNLTVGNSVNIMVMGDANIEVNGQTQATFHGQVDIGAAKDVNMVVGGDFNLQVDGNFNTKVGKDSVTQSTGMTTFKTGKDFAVQSAANTSLYASENAYTEAGGTQNILAAGNVNVHGAEFHGQEGSAEASLDVVDTTVSITAPSTAEAAADTYELLQTPVRPAPPVDFKINLGELEDYQNNPGKYYDAEAAAAGVNANRPPQPDVGDAGQSIPPSGAETSDIQAFLTKQLALAKEGYWSETAIAPGKPSNPNILAMWKDIGMANIGVNDQVAWCMAFVNWTLKQCNYRYAQSARAFDMRDKPQKWGATKVTEPQPGDVIVWSYSHVSFVWKYENGKVYPVGGNQGGKTGDNNPKGGTVTQNYPNGISPSHSNIIGIYRPSKA